MRADFRTKLLQVVILTVSKEEQTLINSYNLSGIRYIRKPVDCTGLTEGVEQLKLHWRLLNEQLSSTTESTD